jgi:hypothetical protein
MAAAYDDEQNPRRPVPQGRPQPPLYEHKEPEKGITLDEWIISLFETYGVDRMRKAFVAAAKRVKEEREQEERERAERGRR